MSDHSYDPAEVRAALEGRAVVDDAMRADIEYVRRRLAGRLSAKLRRHIGGTDDLVQQVLLKAIRAAARVTLSSSRGLRAWLLSIAWRVICDEDRRMRTERRTPRGAEVLGETNVDLGMAAGSAAGPRTLAEGEERHRLVQVALGQLDEIDRAVIQLHHFEEVSFADIGRRLDTTEDAARMRFNRAMLKLRRIVDRMGCRGQDSRDGPPVQEEA